MPKVSYEAASKVDAKGVLVAVSCVDFQKT
jgi:hypothetical protein